MECRRGLATRKLSVRPSIRPTVCLSANFLPASNSFIDTSTVRSANFANSASLPHFVVSATFRCHVHESDCHFCQPFLPSSVVTWPFQTVIRATAATACRTHITQWTVDTGYWTHTEHAKLGSDLILVGTMILIDCLIEQCIKRQLNAVTAIRMNEWKCSDLKCIRKPTSRLSLPHHANKSSRWAE